MQTVDSQREVSFESEWATCGVRWYKVWCADIEFKRLLHFMSSLFTQVGNTADAVCEEESPVYMCFSTNSAMTAEILWVSVMCAWFLRIPPNVQCDNTKSGARISEFKIPPHSMTLNLLSKETSQTPSLRKKCPVYVSSSTKTAMIVNIVAAAWCLPDSWVGRWAAYVPCNYIKSGAHKYVIKRLLLLFTPSVQPSGTRDAISRRANCFGWDHYVHDIMMMYTMYKLSTYENLIKYE